MVGPVLYQEMVSGTRRNRVRIFRYCYALWILIAPLLFVLADLIWLLARRQELPSSFVNDATAWFVQFLVGQNYLILLLAAPVLTAGAITDEKWSGTLQYLLVTELFSWEILVGKLFARMYQVLLLALTPVPWICFLGVFGGIDPQTLLMIAVTSVVLAFSLGCMSLLASVLCRNTRDAILGFFTVGAIVLYGGGALWNLLARSFMGTPTGPMAWIARAVECLDPLRPIGPGWNQAADAERWELLATSAITWTFLGVLCLVPATWWLRSSYLRYLQSTPQHRWGPIVFAWVSAWTLLGAVAFVLFLLVTGDLPDYLDGRGPRSFWRALRDFVAIWDGVTLLPLVLLIAVLAFARRSGWALDTFHNFRQSFWLTRRARIHGDPLRWKERHLEGIAPLAILRHIPRWLGVSLIMLLTTTSSLVILGRSLASPATPGTAVRALLNLDVDGVIAAHRSLQSGSAASGFYWQAVIVLLVATFVIGVRCSGAVTQERGKNTWEALLLTPLETRQLIRSKLWGIIGASMPYLAAYALPAVLFSLVGGVVAVFWVVVWLAVTLLAMAFIGSAGLWCSVRMPGSLWSLLGTLGIGYVGGFIIYSVMFFFGIMFSCAVMMVLMMISQDLGNRFARSGRTFVDMMCIVACVLLALTFFFATWLFVRTAEYRVSIMERTKHWWDEPKHPRWSRYARERRRRREDDEVSFDSPRGK
jgi:ABC-type transport system involved in multi-copper enzyme maturation permease subunit